MDRAHRVIENLNAALRALLAVAGVYLLGEDVSDPYGGAFKATKGLSSAYPERVISTPISENALVGVANGLALQGNTVIVEIMFADFAGLAFDQVLNMTSKSTSMYGARLPMRVLIRLPVGGGRGYGPTHSQSPQKHFLGIPDLRIVEINAYRDSLEVLRAVLETGGPALVVEDKVLYTRRMADPGPIDELFHAELLPGPLGHTRITMSDNPEELDCLLIAAGGMADRAVEAARRLALESDLLCQVIVPTLLHPFDVEPIAAACDSARIICVAEESTGGGTWGADIAQAIYQRCWPNLQRPIVLAHSDSGVIPAAVHLERNVLIDTQRIVDAVRKGLDG
ncbi:alpha-ketoacid dehydrogenase subunit beta [Nocardia sp. NPDC056100]|uniref:alpha-ketoacid dehydrogenase subunit beta n=1 Tax=Nocardia sp. NPDC056100 TaxID=3345712 RepID=UPI0035DF6CC0